MYAAQVRDIDRVEKALHTAFSPDRENPKREFFEIEATQAIAILKLLELENVSPLVEQEANVTDAARVYAHKRPRMNFEEMGIPIGSELSFNNSGEIAVVISDRIVQFIDEETSLTNATRPALGESYAYNVVPGPYWSFNGRRLRDVYNDLNNEIPRIFANFH